MIHSNSNNSKIMSYAILAALVCICLRGYLIFTPLWQDDYAFFYEAQHLARWYDALLPMGPETFWRPISTGLYWLFVSKTIGLSSIPLHLINLFLFGAAVSCVGILSGQIASSRQVRHPEVAALATGLLFGSHGSFFLPLAWVSASQELFALLFGTLFLLFWFFSLSGRAIFRIFALVMLLAALASKEGSIIFPLFAILLQRSVQKLPGIRKWRWEWAPFILAFLWIFTRKFLTVPPDPGSPYSYVLGPNIFRNIVAHCAFLLNTPRDAIRLIVESHSLFGIVWAVFSALPQVLAILIILVFVKKSAKTKCPTDLYCLGLWVIGGLIL